MDTGDTGIVDPGDVVPQEFGGDRGLLRNGDVAGTGGDDGDLPDGFLRGTGSDDAYTADGVVLQGDELGDGIRLLPVDTGDHHRPHTPFRHDAGDGDYLLGGLPGTVDDLGDTLADTAVEVHLRESQVLEGFQTESQHGVVHREVTLGEVRQYGSDHMFLHFNSLQICCNKKLIKGLTSWEDY